MTTAAERVQRILESGWETYPEDLPMILKAMIDEEQRDHLIIGRTSGWPAYAQIAGFSDEDEHMLHAEIQHPAVTVLEGEPEPELPQAVVEAFHADGWQDPKDDYSPNFWIEVSTKEANDLANKIMKAMFANMPPHEITSMTIEAWGPAFGTE